MDRWFHDVAMAVVELGAWCDSVTEDEYRGQLTAMGVTGQGFQEDIGNSSGRHRSECRSSPYWLMVAASAA
jgi:hypothetical protein